MALMMGFPTPCREYEAVALQEATTELVKE